jgi:hypothetical protein
MRKIISYLVAIIITAVIVGGAAYYWQNPKKETCINILDEESGVVKQTETVRDESIKDEELKEVSLELVMQQLEQDTRKLLLPINKYGRYEFDMAEINIPDMPIPDSQEYCPVEPQIEPANISIKYTDEKTGLSFYLPFNTAWGSKYHKINPYDKKGDIILFGPVHFEGYPHIAGGAYCGHFYQFYSLEILPHREFRDIVNEYANEIKESLFAHLEAWHFWDSPTTTTDVVGFSARGELGGYPTIIEVIGPEYNYKFSAKNFPPLEEFKKIVIPIVNRW